jgi:putative ABC transport system substrate-binding protein
MINRRTFLCGLSLGMLSAPLAAEAQPAGKVHRIGYLVASSAATNAGLLEAFQEGLRERGYIEGRNIVIERRFADGHSERLPALAAELVNLKLDLIFAGPPEAARAVKEATSVIPIVFALGDALGLVASLARPGGNVTGVASIASELAGKRLELLKQVVPKVSRVAVLSDPSNPNSPFGLTELAAAARLLRIELHILEVRRAEDLKSAFHTAAQRRVGGLIALNSSLFFLERVQLAELAMMNRLPAVYGFREYAEAGGLIAYGANVPDQFRRAAVFVDKILKGAKPADLPVEQPTKFELVINLKTAKALGLTIPQSLLLRADEIIQ